MTKHIPQKSKESPALAYQSRLYPERYNGRVPLKVKLLRTVQSEIPLPQAWQTKRDTAYVNQEYYVWVNMHGAVSAVLEDGECLGLRPGEFAVIEWWPEDGPDG